MIARVAALALLTLTGACTLSSNVALIAPGVAVPELKTGTYRIYLPLEEADALKLGDVRAKACLKTVRSVEGSDTPDGPRRTERIVYCDRDPETGEGPYDLELRGTAGAYTLKGPEGETSLAFKGLGDGRYLAQSEKAPPSTAFEYTLAGFHGDDIDVFTLGCDEFPSVKQTDGAGATRCEIASFDPVTPELAKVIERIEAGTKAPLVILKLSR